MPTPASNVGFASSPMSAGSQPPSGYSPRNRSAARVSQPLYAKKAPGLRSNATPSTPTSSSSTPMHTAAAGSATPSALQFRGGSILDADDFSAMPQSPSVHMSGAVTLTPASKQRVGPSTPVSAMRSTGILGQSVTKSSAGGSMSQLSDLELDSVLKMQGDQTDTLQEYIRTISELEVRVNRLKRRFA